MSTITLPNIRVGSDLQVRVRLKDGGVAIDWSTLQNIKACIYSDAQRALAGRCSISIDAEDPTLLVCNYAANKPQYLGANRVVISVKYLGETKTYDKPAFTFVRWTDDQAGEQITIDDPDVDVEIEVEDISSSILQEAVDAAFAGAERANEAAAAAEHMVDIHTGPAGKSPYIGENGHWYEWDEETHQYVDTETNAKGNTGETPDISIGTVTTVEPGTPAAASMGGTPEAPVLNLSIPKGAVGATPNFTVGTVTTGQPGTPVVVTITGTPEAPVLNLTIPQGMQGNTGSSVDYPYELVNNLTTNDATKGLSAAQGVVLDGKVSQLEAKVDGVVYTEGKYLDKNGAEQVHADWGITDYIPYTQGNAVIWKWGNPGTVDSGRAICFYDANKNFISNGYWQVSGSTGQKTISASAIATDAPTAEFLRASVLPAQSPAITIGSTVVWQVVKGLTKEIEEVSNDLNTLSLRVDNGIYSEIQNPVYRNQTYIRYSDGELIGSGTYSDTISFPNLGYSKVKVTVALPDSGVAAIAFYNGKIGWAETYISGVQGSAGTHTYEANVPDGCTVIVVTNRNNVLASPSILTTVNGYVGSLATLINYNNPFGNKPFMFHFEPDGFLKDGDGNNLVPGECLESIRIASRLGFAFIEANVKKTSDGYFYVMHGQDGKFGDTVYSLDETDISETELESVTLDYIQENIRYKSIESKYAKLATLEEFLQTAKDCGIGVFLGTQEIDAIKLGIKYLGQDNILVYGAPSWYRSIFKGFMNIWHNTPTTLTVEELLAEADHFGRPYIGSIGPSLISALKSSNSLNTYVEEMHKRGYCVGFASAYQTEEEARELIRMGFDFSGAGHDVNPFIPNYEQIDINGDSSQFVTTGTFDGHTLVLASGQSVSFGNQTRISLGMGRLLLKFNGAITVTFGSFGARTVTSSGEETVVISDYFLRRGTDCTITATANTTIVELAYLTSKC